MFTDTNSVQHDKTQSFGLSLNHKSLWLMKNTWCKESNIQMSNIILYTVLPKIII